MSFHVCFVFTVNCFLNDKGLCVSYTKQILNPFHSCNVAECNHLGKYGSTVLPHNYILQQCTLCNHTKKKISHVIIGQIQKSIKSELIFFNNMDKLN